jgi:hypothetical protein
MKQSMRRRQQGMTFLGLLVILAMVAVIGYAGIRLVPVYLNYMKIVRTMESTAAEAKGDNPDFGAMRNSFDRHWQIEDITVVTEKDIEITKDASGTVTMHIAYDDSAPYIANVSLTVHFDKTVKVR